MIKVDIVNEVSKIADITKVKAEVAVDAVFDAMRLSMQRGDRIELRGFGVFQVKPRKRGIGRNPRTGKEVRIPPGARSGSSPVKTCRISGKPPVWAPPRHLCRTPIRPGGTTPSRTDRSPGICRRHRPRQISSWASRVSGAARKRRYIILFVRR